VHVQLPPPANDGHQTLHHDHSPALLNQYANQVHLEMQPVEGQEAAQDGVLLVLGLDVLRIHGN
jgi:hypothetical protein